MSLPTSTGQAEQHSKTTATETEPELPLASNWTIDVSEIRTVKVSNISLSASERDLKEFFSFSGDVDYVEMRNESEMSQQAYVTFKDSEGADTAMLLTGATIGELSVTVEPAKNYRLPDEARRHETSVEWRELPPSGSAMRKAEEVVSSVLAKGFVMARDAVKRARDLDERNHRIVATARAAVASFDRRVRLSERIGTGRAAVGEKVREVDERYRVSEATRTALAAAEQRASVAGAALMGNRYVSAGASWVSGAVGAVAKAAGDVGSMTRQKVEEEENKEKIVNNGAGAVCVRDLAAPAPVAERPPPPPSIGLPTSTWDVHNPPSVDI